MKQNEIAGAPEITEENFANMFNIYFKNETELTYSINRSVYFNNTDNLSPSKYTIYECQEKDQWSTISYKFYDTIDLWWLICKINHITDPVLISPIPGDRIKLVNPGLVAGILQHIKMQ